ncbi:hypothetical protein IT82_08190 [Listeria monocytogenes]|nr:hypothetical protein [Listeria monocytogenes]ECQ6354506.1 hypothetical protein [Listeria innocua]EAC8326091.1 hypothetical protein [Listeria monocytogenes]EAC8328908.1 hypothetical protein [Listeria monocytogenes]EAC8635886.1 hypothetical protein [Listeria monocytogenes]
MFFQCCFFNFYFTHFCASSLSIIRKPCPLIIAPHAFSFCERFVNLCLGNWLKHVFYVSIFSTFSLKNKKTL